MWKDISFASSPAIVAHPFTGHHYINMEDTSQQWMVTFFPRGDAGQSSRPFVEVKTLTDVGEGETVWTIQSIVPVAVKPLGYPITGND